MAPRKELNILLAHRHIGSRERRRKEMEDETAMMEDFAMENFRLPQSPPPPPRSVGLRLRK